MSAFARRSGRPRKITTTIKREKNGRPSRRAVRARGQDAVTQNLLLRRQRITNNKTCQHDMPISIMRGRGMIDQQSYEAALKFAMMHYRLYQPPFPSALDLVRASMRGARMPYQALKTPVSEHHEKHEKLLSQHYRLCDTTIDESLHCNRLKQLFMQICVYQEPGFLLSDLLLGKWSREHAKIAEKITQALDDLAQMIDKGYWIKL